MRRWVGARALGFGMASTAALTLLSIAVLMAAGCGYHRVGAGDLPQNIHSIAIPGFVSLSQTFRVEQVLTDAVVREFNARTQYHVVHEANGDADAVLKATVLSASATPLAYDSQTGRAVSALVTVSIQVTLSDRQGKVLFENPAYLFHDQYEISRDLPSFFQEDSPAVDRLSRDFAHTLVANILEAY
jgi:outer membrane lipopolysaccharide assembly protein LptE/RlpB